MAFGVLSNHFERYCTSDKVLEDQLPDLQRFDLRHWRRTPHPRARCRGRRAGDPGRPARASLRTGDGPGDPARAHERAGLRPGPGRLCARLLGVLQ